MIGMILFAASTACVATGNTESAEVMSDVVCDLFKAEKVNTKEESGKSLRIAAKLGEEMTRRFRAVPKEDVDETLLGLCIVFGSRILKAAGIHFKIQGSDGKSLADWKCPALPALVPHGGSFPQRCGSLPRFFTRGSGIGL